MLTEINQSTNYNMQSQWKHKNGLEWKGSVAYFCSFQFLPPWRLRFQRSPSPSESAPPICPEIWTCSNLVCNMQAIYLYFKHYENFFSFVFCNNIDIFSAENNLRKFAICANSFFFPLLFDHVWQYFSSRLLLSIQQIRGHCLIRVICLLTARLLLLFVWFDTEIFSLIHVNNYLYFTYSRFLFTIHTS